MKLEQAVFTSAQTQNGSGYHLVARSAGIDEAFARELIRWSPSHGALLSSDVHAESVNFHPVGPNHVCLSRTFCGEPEYSGRGGWQLVTRMAVIPRQLLAGYDDHPLELFRMLRALGHLRWQMVRAGQLPALEGPDETAARFSGGSRAGSTPAPQVFGLLRKGRQVACAATRDPLEDVHRLIDALPNRDRTALSFTTGLKPSVHRPFRLHMLPANVDESLRRRLTEADVVCLGFASEETLSERPSAALEVAH